MPVLAATLTSTIPKSVVGILIYGIPLLISIYYSFYKFNKKLCLYLVLASLGAPIIFKNYIAQALAIHTKLNK